MKLEININSEIIDFCRLNGLDLTIFVQDCIDKGYMENKWGRTPVKSKINEEEPKPKKNTKKPTKKAEQKKSEVITLPTPKPIVDLYDEN